MVITNQLLAFFAKTREDSEAICKPLKTEDYVVQPVVDVSPPKWHLGHTTWFFEEFILKKFKIDYEIFDEDFAFVFNSYYESMGKRVVRTDRGNLSRPGVAEVYAYRTHVNKAMQDLLQEEVSKELADLIEIGIHHEKQHQELLLTDVKFILGNNPMLPVYSRDFPENPIQELEQQWISIQEGIYWIGHDSDSFCYDNELGRHKVFIHDYQISNKLVTNGEYLEFMNGNGYKNHEYWHAEAWDWINRDSIQAPLYWHLIDGEWHIYSMQGLKKINSDAPLTHISYYEAFAFAQYKGMRLPTEFEWEAAQSKFIWGSRWEWTESAYLPYPNYTKSKGALGEYNGKFMVNQKVLRGASVATPKNHTRYSYRNFFHPNLRWQFNGIRLVK